MAEISLTAAFSSVAGRPTRRPSSASHRNRRAARAGGQELQPRRSSSSRNPTSAAGSPPRAGRREARTACRSPLDLDLLEDAQTGAGPRAQLEEVACGSTSGSVMGQRSSDGAHAHRQRRRFRPHRGREPRDPRRAISTADRDEHHLIVNRGMPIPASARASCRSSGARRGAALEPHPRARHLRSARASPRSLDAQGQFVREARVEAERAIRTRRGSSWATRSTRSGGSWAAFHPPRQPSPRGASTAPILDLVCSTSPARSRSQCAPGRRSVGPGRQADHIRTPDHFMGESGAGSLLVRVSACSSTCARYPPGSPSS